MSPTAVTEHAIDRYIERWCLGWPRLIAAQDLRRQLARAEFVEHPAGEDAIWRTSRGCLIVVREDGMVATVLPRNAVKPATRSVRR
jgi:hypothetical protein